MSACSVIQPFPTLWPHGLQLTRLLCPWDFPGKNLGVGCHFLLLFWGQKYENKRRVRHLDSKESACNVGNLGSIRGLGRSPEEGNGNLLQYSCLENPVDRGAWEAVVYRVTKSRTWLKHLRMHSTWHLIVWWVNVSSTPVEKNILMTQCLLK